MGVMTETVRATLYQDLKLSKKSFRWVTKLLYEEKKKELVRTCKVFVTIFTIFSWPS